MISLYDFSGVFAYSILLIRTVREWIMVCDNVWTEKVDFSFNSCEKMW